MTSHRGFENDSKKEQDRKNFIHTLAEINMMMQESNSVSLNSRTLNTTVQRADPRTLNTTVQWADPRTLTTTVQWAAS